MRKGIDIIRTVMKPEYFISEIGDTCERCGKETLSRTYPRVINKKWMKLCTECWESMHNNRLALELEKRGKLT